MLNMTKTALIATIVYKSVAMTLEIISINVLLIHIFLNFVYNN